MKEPNNIFAVADAAKAKLAATEEALKQVQQANADLRAEVEAAQKVLECVIACDVLRSAEFRLWFRCEAPVRRKREGGCVTKESVTVFCGNPRGVESKRMVVTVSNYEAQE